jgi:APA family basic amino acid/polyamine antiporter
MNRWSAAALVVTSMIGTGVFTTTGLVLGDLGAPWLVLLLWVAGGVLAACGAVSYAELSSLHPHNGGEYALLNRFAHPSIGFVAGVVGVFAGFAGPIAASSLAFGRYAAAAVPAIPPVPAALALIAGAAVLQGWNPRIGRGLHLGVTALELALVAAFVALGLGHSAEPLVGPPVTGGPGAIALGLVFVSYAYSGWNTTSYVAGELADPRRDGPWSVVVGTAVVTALYVGLNLAMLTAVPPAGLAGVVEVGDVAARAWLGPVGGRVVSALIAWCLAAMVVAMFEAGPRLTAAIASDIPAIRPLAARTRHGAPIAAVVLLAVAGGVMALFASFEWLLTWMGILLAASTVAVVAMVPRRRSREPGVQAPFRVPFYPVPPVLFVVVTGWMIAQSLVSQPSVAAGVIGLLAVGLLGGLLVAPINPPDTRATG